MAQRRRGKSLACCCDLQPVTRGQKVPKAASPNVSTHLVPKALGEFHRLVASFTEAAPEHDSGTVPIILNLTGV